MQEGNLGRLAYTYIAGDLTRSLSCSDLHLPRQTYIYICCDNNSSGWAHSPPMRVSLSPPPRPP